MKSVSKIIKYMTTSPHTIGDDFPLKDALDLMQSGNYRHMPVQHGGKLVGVLSDRDVRLALSFGTPDSMRVRDVMTNHPYTVGPDADLDDVVEEMAEYKYGCAVVLDNGKVVGIFTATDGLRTFAEILRQRFHK